MRKLFTILVAVLLTATLWAQTPEKMSYQAVIRNSSDALVTNTEIGMEINIHQGTPTGTVVYTETQTSTTNANGLLSIEIGGGTGFNAIDWANGPYFIETKTDIAGGTNYTITGISQLLSVPYALHAKIAETVTGEISETDPVFTSWDKSTGITISESQIGDLGNYLESETDPVFTLWDKSTGISITESQVSDLGNYLESETDPVFTSWDKSTGITITESQISDLGNYIESETDPVFGISVAAGITAADTAGWNNKLDSYTETDPVFSAWDKSYNDLTNKPDLSVYATKNMDNQNITNLANPVNAQDAATKAYVDALLARIEALEESDLLHNGFTDYRDGNHYNVVKIGNQTWMAENLKYLPSVVGPGTGSETTPYYYVYGYDGTNVADAKATANYTTYGVLYNWSAAMAGSASSSSNPSTVQGVCPSGWHLPSDAEWTQLTDYLGGESVAGGKLKETGTTHWSSPNAEASNETGFTALPGGYRDLDGSFYYIGYYGTWWSATEYNATSAWYRYMNYHYSDVYRDYLFKEFGFSVRCVRD